MVSRLVGRPPQAACSCLPALSSASRVLPSGHSAKNSSAVCGLFGVGKETASAPICANEQTDGLSRDAITAPGEAKLLGGGGLHVNQLRRHTQVVSNVRFHGGDVRRHFWGLGDNRGIQIPHAPAFLANLL